MPATPAHAALTADLQEYLVQLELELVVAARSALLLGHSGYLTRSHALDLVFSWDPSTPTLRENFRFEPRGIHSRTRRTRGGGTALVIDVHSRRRPKERCSSYMSLLQHCYIVKFSFSIRSFARHFAAPSPKCREPLLHHPLARFFAAAQPSFGKRVDHTLCVRSLDLPLAPGREGSLASSPTREARRGIGDHSANWATHSDMG